MKILKKSIILVLVVSLLAALCACSKTNTSEKISETSSTAEASASTKGDVRLKTSLIPEYTHCDPTEFYENCSKLVELGNSQDTEALISLYEKLLSEYERVHDDAELTDILYSEDTHEDHYQKENAYCVELKATMRDKLCQAGHDVITGPSGDAFREYLNEPVTINGFENYKPADESLSSLIAEEASLANEYSAIWNDTSFATYTYNGKTYTFDEISSGEKGNRLIEEDYNGYFEVYEACIKQVNEKAGEIYLKLIDLRKKIAELKGYENFADYSDKEVYGRSYTEEELNSLKTAVANLGSSFVIDYYDILDYQPEYIVTGQELVDNMESFLGNISPYLDNSYNFFKSNKLYSIGSEDCRVDMAWASEPLIDPPLIYIKLQHDTSDFSQIVHELGHFTNSIVSPPPSPLFSIGAMGIFEIQSTGLEWLSMNRYDEVFGYDEAACIKSRHISELYLTNIINGCIFDDFERTIYESPDMTMDEINQLYNDLLTKYGMTTYPGSQYEWIYVNHPFTLPMYYADYLTSVFASSQIFVKSLEDYDAAVSMWEKVIEMGGYNYSYQEVLNACGLKTFEDSETDEKILESVLNQASKFYEEAVE